MDDLNNKKNYYFISPHLDDAILSAGALIYELKERGRVKIITIFTKGDKSFLKRKIEDKNVCRFLKINYLHLDFIDALWRNSYRSMEDLFVKKVNSTKEEQNLEAAIVNKLKKTINNEKGLVFAPLSIGNHIDHRIVNKICRDNFTDVIYWEDYPYNLKSKISSQFIKKNNLGCFEFKKNIFRKEKLIKFYSSQIQSLFGDKPIIIKKERYYFLPQLKFINNLF